MTIPTREEALAMLDNIPSDYQQVDELKSRLRSYIESHTGEPVAWRIENYPGGEWCYFDSLKSACRYAADHDKLEPLYASPVQPDPITANQVIEFMERETGLPFGDMIGMADCERIKAMALSIGDK